MTTVQATTSRVAKLLTQLSTQHPDIEVVPGTSDTLDYARDRARNVGVQGEVGPAVAFPQTREQVQALVRAAAAWSVPVIARGAGSGLSGAANATSEQLVISTERLTRVLEIAPLDQVAVVEPGVINAHLNPQLADHGLFYAPDPASYAISTIGGNIATNAGGLHCAKYGVTGDSILALDVVLPDGELIRVGHRSIKGVAGLDLVSLFVGSEGILGIVVAATLRLRKIPVATRTLTAFFDSTVSATRGLEAVTRSPVEPAVVEFFDEPTLQNIDESSGTQLRQRGAALILIELDGYGIEEQTRDITGFLREAGGTVTAETASAGQEFWELRRGGRGLSEDYWAVGEDIAVPKSQIPEIYASFAPIAERFGVEISAISHAGDGNLHPLIKRKRRPGDPTGELPSDVSDAADAVVRRALELGGTISGEHGVGTVKLTWLGWELSERNHDLQRSIRQAVDPLGLLNPGKAI